MATVPDTRGGGEQLGEVRHVRMFEMLLFIVSGILVLDTVATGAAIGVEGLTWWIILAVLFFVPYALLTSELGSAWPDEGGIYVWAKEAFGPAWGSMTAWMYWINLSYWAPSVFVLFVGTMIVAWDLNISTFWECVIVIALIWVTMFIVLAPLKYSKWVASASAVAKVVVVLVLGIAGITYAVKHGSANSFALSQWKPSFSANWAFIPTIVWSLMGFEVMNSAGGAIRNPQRDVPKAIAGAAILIVGAYMLGIVGILGSIKLEDVSIVSGIADALKISFGAVFGGMGWLFDIIIVVIMFTFIGNMVTWTIGCNHTLAATGLDKTAPSVFGHYHKRWGTPDYAIYLTGAVATALTILNYWLFGTREDVFWTIFSLSAVVFLIPFLVMFPALVVLRRKHPDRPRPFRVPGGAVGAWICTVLCTLIMALVIFIFFYQVPEGTPRGIFYGICGGGTLVSMLIGWILYLRAKGREADAQD
ncbi:MAG TPA: APC family permease [Thermoleophilia bacterium]|nr:APC family permease [Acidobacteriota bacterium]NLT92838.1 APC family permease [Actinomycetota bacterium]HQH22396.1 APC family permease [Thermoleophilia bacterium]